MIVRHHSGEYPIRFVGPKELDHEGLWLIDENVLRLWPSLGGHDPIVIPSGETSKSMARYEEVVRMLAQRGAKRNQQLIAVGGGVVGDLVGFAASTFLRGVPFVQIPTTLLAMVDSSVGGKVGIDLPEGKNLVGAFWPPVQVDVATDFLSTLPERHFRNGMAEVWKYAFIEDWSVSELALHPEANLTGLIQRCIEIKAQIVEEDEYDRTGRRAILNFGHSMGHAIETVHNYETYLHGEAIAIGMVAEARLGERLGLTEVGTADRIAACLTGAGLPTEYGDWQNPGLIEAMRRDKKNEGDGLAFSLVTQLGECKLTTGIAESDVRAFLESL
jgi:3-dehydroquinate synthase